MNKHILKFVALAERSGKTIDFNTMGGFNDYAEKLDALLRRDDLAEKVILEIGEKALKNCSGPVVGNEDLVSAAEDWGCEDPWSSCYQAAAGILKLDEAALKSEWDNL